jgi:hypothetical protein
LSTQPFYRTDTGAHKAKILAHSLYRALGVKVDARIEELRSDNALKLLDGLVIDAFDNSASRAAVKAACEEAHLSCLHVGLANGYAEVIWNESYRVPSASQDDICDYPLARNLVMLTVAVACEVVMLYVATGQRESYTITLGDFAVRRFCV